MERRCGVVAQVFTSSEGLAVELPEAVVKELGLREGDDVEIDVVGPRRLALSRSAAGQDVRDVLQRLRAYRGRLPADFRLDRSDANQRQD